MVFSPFVVGSGLGAWSFLKTTLARQKLSFEKNFSVESNSAYFKMKHSSLQKSEDIVNDPKLMFVVLGAYGLSEDINNKFFIGKVLKDGISDQTALVNRLSDRRYKTLASDFDFSSVSAQKYKKPGFVDTVLQKFRDQSFEKALGLVNDDLRLALGFKRLLAEVSKSTQSNTAAWFHILGTPPLRTVFETALSFPKEFANLDIDEQHNRMMEKASKAFGTNQITELSVESKSEAIVQRFLLMKQASSVQSNGSLQTALVLLSSATR
jgi:hypothetical protein